MAKGPVCGMSAEPETITPPVEGMSCDRCAPRITEALLETDGVLNCKVDHLQKGQT